MAESCRICLDDGNLIPLISLPCHSTDSVLIKCQKKWLNVAKSEKCEVCQFKFTVIRQKVSAVAKLKNRTVQLGLLGSMPFTAIFIGFAWFAVSFATDKLDFPGIMKSFNGTRLHMDDDLQLEILNIFMIFPLLCISCIAILVLQDNWRSFLFTWRKADLEGAVSLVV